jgi:hypothetical protein
VTWHQFRHIHSSLLNDLRVPVKIAQEQLGHSSISTTLNIYTHVVDALHRKVVEAVERELFGEDLDPNPDRPNASKPFSACITLEERLEAPPGFEPGMEVLQIGPDSLSC